MTPPTPPSRCATCRCGHSVVVWLPSLFHSPLALQGSFQAVAGTQVRKETWDQTHVTTLVTPVPFRPSLDLSHVT